MSSSLRTRHRNTGTAKPPRFLVFPFLSNYWVQITFVCPNGGRNCFDTPMGEFIYSRQTFRLHNLLIFGRQLSLRQRSRCWTVKGGSNAFEHSKVLACD